jgi:hypothetical protein
MGSNGLVAELARARYELNDEPTGVLPPAGDVDPADLVHYYHKVEQSTMESLIADTCQLLWLACDAESEEVTDVLLAEALADLALRFDKAGIKWTSGR